MQDAPPCLNCGTAAPLNFCPMCGQETKVHVPSAREFIHEFVTHYVALEGKLWRTLKLMITKPGALTSEYLAGRRATYIIPLRIFLTFSILFFATLKLTNVELVSIGDDAREARAEKAVPERGVAKPPAATPSAAGTPAGAARERVPGDEKNENDLRDMAVMFGPGVAAKFDQYMGMPADQRKRVIASGFYSYAPYAMLLLMPVFALYLKLLYLGTGRRYGEHFLFALHTNAFAYLQLTLVMLSPFSLLSFLLVGWLVFYLPIAMRRVYGGSRFVTFLRWLVLAFLHLLSLSVAVLAALILPMMA
ncbi:MAG TPA: DUF3667 domain-containing protein [Telluria sp.]|nr:DUF3667 domain-containing protein [Telluria sp.]